MTLSDKMLSEQNSELQSFRQDICACCNTDNATEIRQKGVKKID